jgi:orotidine-5'-phosphate decarboxylase
VSFADRLMAAISRRNSRVCVGLDPRVDSLPAPLRERAASGPDEAAAAVREFCCRIVDAVADLAAVVKPQAAFFEALGPAGYAALWDIMAYAAHRGGLPVILDAKRSDIGSTAAAYAEAYFAPPGGLRPVDALTVNAYLGSDGVLPFVEAAGKAGGGIFVLAKTSNPSSGELQDLLVRSGGAERPVFAQMGLLAAEWGQGLVGASGYSSVGAVVGATYPQQLAELRQDLPTVPFLVPGYGAQGGGADDVKPAFDAKGLGAIVNSSRGIIFAYNQEPYRSRFSEDQYAEAAAQATKDMRDDINAALGL